MRVPPSISTPFPSSSMTPLWKNVISGSDPPVWQVNDCGFPLSLSCTLTGRGSFMTAGSVGKVREREYVYVRERANLAR